MPDPPWLRYRVGPISSRPNWTNESCQPFDDVSHVAHISAAVLILRDRIIRPGLVFDKSKLRTQRILVVWASPNYWALGFRYGNVSFEFSWRELVANRNYYWVEDMTEYNPTACRILITRKEYKAATGLIAYDPTFGDGPWWFDAESEVDYFNGKFCLEFMLEDELSPADAKKISFVKHHQQFCCVDATTCKDKGLLEQEASARMLAGIIAEDIDVAPFDIAEISGGWGWITIEFPKSGYGGDVGRGDATAVPLLRSALFAYFRRREEEFKALCRLFYGKGEAEATLEKVVKSKFPKADLR